MTLNDGNKYLAFRYNENYSDESSADIGYIKYLNCFLNGRHKNLPTVKGVHYPQSSVKGTHSYPTLVVENLRPLKEVAKLEIPAVTQISMLFDIASSIASFEKDTEYQVSVFSNLIFVKENFDLIAARFCPLYYEEN